MTSDINSNGFRPMRGAKNAIGSVQNILQSGQESKWIMHTEIKSFLHEINHDWLITNLPLPKPHKLIVQQWIISGDLLDETTNFSATQPEEGQIISTVLANFTLNGLEEIIRYSSIKPSTGRCENNAIRKNDYKEGVREKSLSLKL